MKEELNVYDIVRYFLEKSWMLFFYTREDVKLAYDRIKTILSSEEKYNGRDVSQELEDLDKFYNYFINNFDEYSQIEENKNLFVDIMRIDSNIMFYGNSKSLRRYLSREEKKIN